MKKFLPYCLLLLTLPFFEIYSINSKDFVVFPSSKIVIDSNNLYIQLEFEDKFKNGINIIKKKEMNQQGWWKYDTLEKGSLFYFDTIENGSIFEYGFHFITDSLNSYGYYLIGNSKMFHIFNGKALILVDSTIYELVIDENQTFLSDLENDGWLAEIRKVPRAEKFNPIEVYKVKRIVNSYKKRWGKDFRVLILIGRVPVPYSGNYSFDGHSNHFGAFPSDLVYIIDDSLLTDEIEYNLTAEREENWNVPFDSKYDQTTIPRSIGIAVGRIDFSNLTYFDETEAQLIKNYFKKNHLFRSGKGSINFNGLIDDGFGTQSEEIFAANAWMNFYPLCDTIVEGKFFENISKKYYHFAYACNSGSYTSVWSSINSEQCANYNLYSTFVFLFGSYFWDWDTKDNLLRSILASSPNVLITSWIGRPFWHFHHFIAGTPFATSFIETANNSIVYETTGKFGYKGMHLEVLGDPTLRIIYPEPIEKLNIEVLPDKSVELIWEPPALKEYLYGYLITRKSPYSEHYELIAIVSKETTNYIDTIPNYGKYFYQVKSLHKRTTSFGSFIYPSIGTTEEIEIK